jgi:mono/diheme cytochrome c family protein
MKFLPGACLLVIGLALASSCAQEDLPQAVFDSRQPGARKIADGGGAALDATTSMGGRPDGGPHGSGQCVQALAEPLPARIAVISASAAPPPPPTVTLQSIYDNLWQPHCLQCHNNTSPAGGYNVASAMDLASPSVEPGFASKGEEALWHIRSDGTMPGARDEVMPPIGSNSPEGVKWSERILRGQSDPLVRVAGWLDAWVQAGSPNSPTTPFMLPAPPAADDAGADAGAPPSYLMTPAVGNGMTNLGNCVADKALVASEQTKSAAQALDDKFANMRATPDQGGPGQRIGLPEHLYETDITTFDSEALARMGVIAFVPQYPLWSDDAGKLRHVRVPRGQSIRFDKATQEFQIPANTRFYKTFMKPIVDTDGNVSWRKIETRLIVSRPDTTAPDGSFHQNALYGSYIWNESETDATLIGTGLASNYSFVRQGDSPLRELDGFQDTVLVYDTDVNLAARVRADNPGDPSALQKAHAVRTYAIPSSIRCVQCHEGSPSQSFVLGFRPVQLWHRARLPKTDAGGPGGGKTDGGMTGCGGKRFAVGEGGVIEPSGPDELSQLQRLIDYGVITGIDSIVSDVLPLEASQGDRTSRNDFELVAQGYMLGNCAHCHNPRGYASVSFPQLTNVFNLLPGPGGGIFQFPLEKVSPRITRGLNGDVHIPYITPSLLDNPSYPGPPIDDPFRGDEPPPGQSGSLWKPKWLAGDIGLFDPAFVYAPWRSLIYRNVDTPFVYADDFAIYPHMPMNTPGYDCRAKQIMADWMVSIPAVRKRTDLGEYMSPFLLDPDCQNTHSTCRSVSDANEQPYVEVKPGTPGYQAAISAANDRLNVLHCGYRTGETAGRVASRYDSCPDTTDIVDPEVEPVCHPVPAEHEDPVINVPTHPHWVPLDLTQSKAGDADGGTTSPWTPRGGEWQNILVADNVNGKAEGGVAPSGACGGDTSVAANKQKEVQLVLDLLTGKIGPGVTLDKAIRDFATTKFPMGFWNDKPECDWSKPAFSGVPTFDQARSSASPPAWAKTRADQDAKRGIADGNRHVYTQTPGAAVFGMICINCHGPNADSKGRLADNLANMTGGIARVADLRDGLFGPLGSAAGSYRTIVFQDTATKTGLGVDDWAARYLAWMALGGTTVTIPRAYLTIIGHTPVLGEARSGLSPPETANMLSAARTLCQFSLYSWPYDLGVANPGYFDSEKNRTLSPQLIWDSGDAELWLRLCSINNPPPVRPYRYNSQPITVMPVEKIQDDPNIPPPPPNTPPVLLRCAFQGGGCDSDGGASLAYSVGDQNGNVSSTLTADNLLPWCVYANPNQSGTKADFDKWLNTHCVAGTDCDSKGNCQGASCVHPPRCPDNWTDLANWDDAAGSAVTQWEYRGAINAGLAVFLYLDGIAKGKSPEATYDQCEKLLQPYSSGDAGAN